VPEPIACPVCGASGDVLCGTRYGTPHAARLAALGVSIRPDGDRAKVYLGGRYLGSITSVSRPAYSAERGALPRAAYEPQDPVGRRVTRADTRTEAAAALVRNAAPCPTCQHSTWTKQHRAHTRFGDRDGR
jgi:hypothetical protein